MSEDFSQRLLVRPQNVRQLSRILHYKYGINEIRFRLPDIWHIPEMDILCMLWRSVPEAGFPESLVLKLTSWSNRWQTNLLYNEIENNEIGFQKEICIL